MGTMKTMPSRYRQNGDRSDKISNSSDAPIIPIEEYRKILEDTESTDEKIVERLQFLEALARNIIRMELEKYVNENKK